MSESRPLHGSNHLTDVGDNASASDSASSSTPASSASSGPNLFERLADVLIATRNPANNNISSMLSLEGQLALSKTNRRHAALFHPVLPITKRKEAVEQAVRTFQTHVVRGNQEAAEAMLQAAITAEEAIPEAAASAAAANQPVILPVTLRELLTTHGAVVGYDGLLLRGNAWHMVRHINDVAILVDGIPMEAQPNRELMAEMLMKYFIGETLPAGVVKAPDEMITGLPDGQTLLQQYDAEHLSGEAASKQQHELDMIQLENVIEAIRTSENNAACDPAIQAWWTYLENKKKEYEEKQGITTGAHFCERLLLECKRLFRETWTEDWRDQPGWDDRKRDRFAINVHDYLLRFAPACVAQTEAQDPYHFVGRNPPQRLQRHFKLYYDPSFSLFPLDSNPASKLGINYYGVVGGAGGWRGGRSADPAFSFFSKLCRAKTEAGNRLCSAYTGPRVTR